MERGANAGVTVFMYGSCIVHLAKCGRWQEGRKILDKMLGLGLQPDILTVNALLHSCGKAKWKVALALLRRVRSTGFALCIISYNTVISACGNCGQWEKALLLLEEMEAVGGVKPNIISYNSAITACGKSHRWEKAVSLLREMPQQKALLRTWLATTPQLKLAVRVENGTRRWTL